MAATHPPNQSQTQTGLGVHVYAIRDSNPEISGQYDQVLISISDGENMEVQYGPEILSPHQLSELTEILNNNKPKLGIDILTHVLDLKRICPDMPLLSPLVTIPRGSGLRQSPAFFYHNDTPLLRKTSMILARQAARYDCKSPTSLAYYERDIEEYVGERLVHMFAVNLRLHRLKWLEVQDEEKKMKRYTLEAFKSKDNKDENNNTTRFRLTQTQWDTHLVRHTKLFVTDTNGERHSTTVEKIKNCIAIFTVPTELRVEDVRGLSIMRGDEQQAKIRRHIQICHEILRGQTMGMNSTILQSRGVSFCANALHLPYVATGHTSQNNNIPVNPSQNDVKLSPVNQPPPQHLSRSARTRYQKKLSTILVNISKDLESDQYKNMNLEQKACTRNTSSLVMCAGYPGTGKTKTLAALVLTRIKQLLNLECGWILCLSNTNASALHMVRHISQYASLRPLLRHSFSPIFKAFHPTLFIDADPYRVTKKMVLHPHGIMVCTIGKLPTLLQKYPNFGKLVLSLVTDESGLIWNFDALLFLPEFANLTHWAMFGDKLQLCPYVTKLSQRGVYHKSIMTFLQSFEQAHIVTNASPVKNMTTHHIRLRVQYRMIPVICNAHAPIYYDYNIITAGIRRRMCNPDHDGLFYERLPMHTELRHRQTLQQYEVDRALSIAQDISRLHLTTLEGTPYTICILSPYTNTVEALRKRTTELGLTHIRMSSIDMMQGCEANVIILTTSRAKLVDLLKCHYRSNVAMSRARDILIVMAHPDLVLRTVRDPLTGKSSLSCWSQLILHAQIYNKNDHHAEIVLHDLRDISKQQDINEPGQEELTDTKVDKAELEAVGDQRRRGPQTRARDTDMQAVTPKRKFKHQADRSGTRTAKSGGYNRIMQMARDYLHGTGIGVRIPRMSFCKMLCLKKKDSLNHNHQRILFIHMVDCNDTTFEQAVRIFATVFRYRDRYDQLRHLFGCDISDIPSRASKRRVAAMYSLCR
jgi:hypothetical protein